MRRWLAVALAASACGEAPPPPGEAAPELRVCAAGETVPGIDVSKYQGTIDWDQVKASGITFAFIRVSDGTGFFDGQFARNWAEARRVGVVRGVYQFFRPGQDPVAQADLLLQNMGPLEPGDLPPALDVEDTDGETADVIVANMHAWFDRVEAVTGRKSAIYSGKYFWNDSVGGATDFIDHPYWIPQWGVTCPDLATAWSGWVFWQTTASGSIPGINGDVDTDVFNGSLADLMAFAVQSAAPCAPVPPEGRVVEDGESCFQPASGTWLLSMDAAGRYQVDAHVSAGAATASQVVYLVHHDGRDDSVTVDPSAANGWLALGAFDFTEGSDQWVAPATVEAGPRVFDSIRLMPVSEPPPPPPPLGDHTDVQGALGCQVGGRGSPVLVLAALLALALRRRR